MTTMTKTRARSARMSDKALKERDRQEKQRPEKSPLELGKPTNRTNKELKHKSQKTIKADFERSRNRLKAKLTLQISCGACRHLDIKNPELAAPCSQLGKTASSPGCAYYNPDFGKTRDQAGLIKELGELVRDMTHETRHVVAYALVNSTRLERISENVMGFPLKMGQPVFVNLSSPPVDALNAYYKARVMAVTRDGQSVILYAKANGRWIHVVKTMARREHIYTERQFKKKRKDLVKAGRLQVPAGYTDYLLPKIPVKKALDWKPKNMAKADPKLLAKHQVSVGNFDTGVNRKTINELSKVAADGTGRIKL